VQAFEYWRRGMETDTIISCELALKETSALALRLRIDLVQAIRDKLTRNQDRPYRNGGKHPDT